MYDQEEEDRRFIELTLAEEAGFNVGREWAALNGREWPRKPQGGAGGVSDRYPAWRSGRGDAGMPGLRSEEAEHNLACQDRPRNVLRGQLWQIDARSGVGVHWLRGSCPGYLRGRLRDVLCGYFGEPEPMTYGLWGFTDGMRWVINRSPVELLWDGDSNSKAFAAHAGKCCLEMAGEAVASLTADKLVLLIHELTALDFQCGRIDTYFDDYDRLVDPAAITAAVEHGDLARFKKWRPNFECMLEGGVNRVTRAEVDFGARGQNGTGKYGRVYDKNLESGGKQDCVRHEYEWTSKKAGEVWAVLQGCHSVEDLARTIGSVVGGAIDFPIRAEAGENDRHLERLSIHAWWITIKDCLGEVKVSLPKTVASIERMVRWVHRAVVPTLAVIREAYRQDGWEEGELDRMILEWFDEGRDRWKDRHIAVLMEYLQPGRLGLSEAVE